MNLKKNAKQMKMPVKLIIFIQIIFHLMPYIKMIQMFHIMAYIMEEKNQDASDKIARPRNPRESAEDPLLSKHPTNSWIYT